MGKSRNIGLVTWFGTPNYGTNLQAYALYKELEERGFNVRIIKRFKTPFSLKNIKDNFFYAHGIRRFWKYSGDPFPAKTRRIRTFCKSEMSVAKVYTECDLKRLLEWADLFIAGSDQLWNCHDHFRGFEFLDFAAGKPKISYATSIGTRDIPEEYEEKVNGYLSDFKHISLREPSGAFTIAAITGRDDIATVLDPVLLRPRSFWETFAARSNTRVIPQDLQAGYTLLYILGASDQAVLPLLLQSSRGRRIVVVPSGEAPWFDVAGATRVTGAGLPEFVALVRNAGLVITDSFHGTALSILFSRPFVNLDRFLERDAASQNIRIKNLLRTLGIPGRNWHGTPLPPIDYPAVQARLNDLRAGSADFLNQALADYA